MAERRMMSKKIIHSDAFLDLPSTTQNLYFHLLLEADDEGFVNSPKRIQRTIGASDIDAQLLLTQKFIIGFESGVVVIKHWRIHNYIQNDRFKPTTYVNERSKLSVEENNGYKLDTNCTPSIGKVRLVEGSIEEVSIVEDFTFSLSQKKSYKNLSADYKARLKDEIEKLNDCVPYEDFISNLEANGYKYQNFLMAYKNWCRKDFNKNNKQSLLHRQTRESERDYSGTEF